MATSVTVSICPNATSEPPHQSLETINSIFAKTERSCSRFDQTSDLSKINSAPDDWHAVTPICFAAIREAHSAYLETRGLFDPRILNDLVSLGYEESWTVRRPDAKSSSVERERKPLAEWHPQFEANARVRVGKLPIDLGGIGKGLALRWSSQAIDSEQADFLIEAGGDCACSGQGPDGQGWNIGVQNPYNPDGDPVMVLRLSDAAVCTSSIAVRSWWRNGALRHHIVDPKTGQPGKIGLAAVTVVDQDPAEAEVWSKSLFLIGRSNIREFSESVGKAAVWVTDNGETVTNSLIENHIIWRNGSL